MEQKGESPEGATNRSQKCRCNFYGKNSASKFGALGQKGKEVP